MKERFYDLLNRALDGKGFAERRDRLVGSLEGDVRRRRPGTRSAQMSIFGVHHHSSLRAEGHLPSFDGATEWLNSAPLSPADLRGQVVLVDFWTLTCINWLRTQPHIRAWSQAYRDDGLVVVGVHTPEFSFEHEIEHVQQAVQQRAIDYPVALDNDYAVWSAFDNQYWPALYFVDEDGIIRDHHFGEGRYEQSERVIQQLLGIERDFVSVKAVGVEAEADWDNLRSPETYLGYARGGHKAPVEHLRLNQWGLAGEWTSGAEKVTLEQANGSIAFRFHARDAHLVLSRNTSDPIPFRVLLDGDAPGSLHGIDVDEQGYGALDNGRLYQLVRHREPVRDRTLEITFFEGGAEAYVFTFG
jgi:thiol-disulfide isomerase/thioredoxin